MEGRDRNDRDILGSCNCPSKRKSSLSGHRRGAGRDEDQMQLGKQLCDLILLFLNTFLFFRSPPFAPCLFSSPTREAYIHSLNIGNEIIWTKWDTQWIFSLLFIRKKKKKEREGFPKFCYICLSPHHHHHWLYEWCTQCKLHWDTCPTVWPCERVGKKHLAQGLVCTLSLAPEAPRVQWLFLRLS